MNFSSTLSHQLSWAPKWAVALALAIAPWSFVTGQDNTETTEKNDAPFMDVAGVVVDEEEKPIAGVHIAYPYAFDRSLPKAISVDTVSDAQGKFRLRLPRVLPDKTAPYVDSLVWAYSKDYCLASARITRNKAGTQASVRLVLPPATDTSFVVWSPFGEPVSDVLVEPINYRSSQGFSAVPDAIKTLVAARTDAKGRVKMPALSRALLYRIGLTINEFGVQNQRLNPSADEPPERDIRLRKVGQVQGHIANYDPEWDSKVKFWFTSEAPMQAGETRPPWPTEGEARVSVDASGRFETRLIAEGRVRIDTIVDEELPVRPIVAKSIEVKSGRTTTLEIPMQKLVQIHGSLIAGDTKMPMPGIKLHIYYGEYRQGTDVVTNEKGQFSAWVLPGGVSFQPMTLHNTKYLQLGQPKPIEVPDTEGFKAPPIEVALSEPRSGKLVNQQGAPIANARVTAYYQNWLCSNGDSNHAGEFRLPKMPVSIESDKATYRVRLANGKTIYSGDVTIKSNSPLVIAVTLP